MYTYCSLNCLVRTDLFGHFLTDKQACSHCLGQTLWL